MSEETKEEIKAPPAEAKKQKLLSRVKIETEEAPSEPKIEEVPTIQLQKQEQTPIPVTPNIPAA